MANLSKWTRQQFHQLLCHFVNLIKEVNQVTLEGMTLEGIKSKNVVLSIDSSAM